MRRILLVLCWGLLLLLAACQPGVPLPEETEPALPAQGEAAAVPQPLLVGTVVNATLVNIRQQPNTEARIIDNALRGVMYRVSKAQAEDGWYEIVSYGDLAYIYQDYLYVEEWQSGQSVTVGTVVNTDSTVNIRREASLESQVAATAGKNERYVVLQPNIAEGWHQIDLSGTPAYIGTAFLEMETMTIDEALN